jgi:hypothetical protein
MAIPARALQALNDEVVLPVTLKRDELITRGRVDNIAAEKKRVIAIFARSGIT